MRLYISADIGAIVGVATPEHTRPGGFEYERARVWMTRSACAVAEAAREVGCDEVVVSDSHGNAQNLLIDDLPQHVRIVRAWPRPLSMMQGVEEPDDVAHTILFLASNPAITGQTIAVDCGRQF